MNKVSNLHFGIIVIIGISTIINIVLTFINIANEYGDTNYYEDTNYKESAKRFKYINAFFSSFLPFFILLYIYNFYTLIPMTK